MIIIGLDPGTVKSAYVVFDVDMRIPLLSGIVLNQTLLGMLRSWPGPAADRLIVEQIESYGKPVGESVFRTVFWAGRFVQTWDNATGRPWEELPRRKVKKQLGAQRGRQRGQDADVTRALLSRYGRDAREPGGALVGITADQWAALAVCVAWCEINTTLFGGPAGYGSAAVPRRVLPAQLHRWRQ